MRSNMLRPDNCGVTSARIGDTCRSAPCADLAYLCPSCDAHIHAANRLWLCHSCHRAPAASLCPSCDGHIPSAKPLSAHHHRLPISPSLYPDEPLLPLHRQDGPAPWFLPDNSINDQGNGFSFDDFLDLSDSNSSPHPILGHDNPHQQPYELPHNHGYACDSVVPVQQPNHFQLPRDFDSSKAAYPCNASVPQNVSLFLNFTLSLSSFLLGIHILRFLLSSRSKSTHILPICLPQLSS